MWGRDGAGNTKLDASRSSGFRLIALDCRGHGKSDKPHDASRYGAEMSEDVVRLLDHLEIEKAHLVGYSSGAFIAGKVAAEHPERVLSIVYAGQAPLVADARTSHGSTEVDIFAKAVEEGQDLGVYLRAVAPGRSKLTPGQARALAGMMFRGKDTKALALAGLSFPKLEVTASQLERCKAPMLFVHGANESSEVKRRVAAVHKLLGRGEVKIIEGGDHVTTLSRPAFSAAILEFLRSPTER
jgi:pimeloyl-ACP methyl ester carboxylesterase